jgi:opacity protein-like surface antigen
MHGLRSFTIAVALAAAMVPAAAADFPVEPIYQARPAVVIFRWTGVYIGAHLGGGTGYKSEDTLQFPYALQIFTPVPVSMRPHGWLAGGQIGANYQVDSWVLGFEAQASWTNLKGSSACPMNVVPVNPGVGSADCSVKLDSMGTIAARLGWAFDRLLIYGKGAAWTNDGNQVLLLATATGQTLLFSTNELRWGWMAGIGVEYAFTDAWSAKIEYNHMDLGTDSLRFNDQTGTVFMDTNFKERIDIVKVGINYRFGVNPILIK